jgi:hypothetical protein
VAALATAMQEAQMGTVGMDVAVDHDSLGVFQQRPSQGWGTVGQLSQPAYQAGKFFDKLQTIPGWQQMSLTEAAQAVQVSAFPFAYAQWESMAAKTVAAYWS